MVTVSDGIVTHITVTLGVDPDTIWAMSESFASLAAFFASGLPIQQPFSHRLALLVDAVDIFDFQDGIGPAPAAEILGSFRVAPSEGYIGLFAAIVGDGHADAGVAAHGWPILVLRGDSAQSATIAEGGATVNPVVGNSCSRRAPGGPR